MRRILSRTVWFAASAAIVAAGGWYFTVEADTHDPGYTSIFNGEDLSGWIGDEAFWRVEDGMIIGETTADNPTDRNTFLIWEEGEVDDFDLRFAYRITSAEANSGIQVRSVHLGDYVVAGYQPDIATVDWITGIHYEERGRGILARRGERVVIDEAGERVAERFAEEDALGEHIEIDDWNVYRVVGQGNTIRTEINGVLMHELVDDGPEARRKGVIAFQLHTGPPMTLQFKDIELKRLPLQDQKKVVFVAGTRSHGYMAHEHYAGNRLLGDLLEEGDDQLLTAIYRDGWPSDPTAFDNADAVVIYANGGGGHPIIPHLDSFEEVMQRGVGLVCLHYAVEVPQGAPGDAFLRWMGGYFETDWSVNPFWDIREPVLPEHPITRGVTPYEINDEWYYHMRFRENMEGVQPILSELPPESSLEREDGPHSGNPYVRRAVLQRQEMQHMAWAAEREDGGRGFGFTGGHWHWNWGHPMQRKLVLNAITWAAGAEVPEMGIPAGVLSMEDLEANQDYDEPDNFNRDRIVGLVETWSEEFN